jgi:hypothetical protein
VLPPEAFVHLVKFIETPFLNRVGCICWQFNQYMDNAFWEDVASRFFRCMLPDAPMQGWKAWVLKPTPLTFPPGTIDWGAKTIWAESTKNLALLMETIIEGHVVCIYPQPSNTIRVTIGNKTSADVTRLTPHPSPYLQNPNYLHFQVCWIKKDQITS